MVCDIKCKPSLVLLYLANALVLRSSYVSATKTIHVVFGSHLDIGFNNIEPEVGWDNNVINKYFNEFFPRAVDVSDKVQYESPHGDRYTYTTSSWMLSMFLDCPPGMGLACPNATTREKVLRGIETGAINYHAHPTKAQLELYDPSLLEFSHKLTHDLDMRFGFKPKNTIVLRDVPGITRAAIPFLAAQGIRGLSVGVNQASAPPDVPFYTPFIWRDEASDTQIIAFWRPGGYGGWHRDMILDPPHECIQAPGLEHVLCTSWRWDNMGPATNVSETLRMFDVLREDWSNSTDTRSSGASDNGCEAATCSKVKVVASTFDAFVDAVWEALPTLNLTVFTGEIGDTWIWGVQSDPLKTANFRAVSRARAACIEDPLCPSQTPEFYNFSRILLKVPDHTWGVDVKKTLNDFVNYSNPDFYACLTPQLWPHGQHSQIMQKLKLAGVVPAMQPQLHQVGEHPGSPTATWLPGQGLETPVQGQPAGQSAMGPQKLHPVGQGGATTTQIWPEHQGSTAAQQLRAGSTTMTGHHGTQPHASSAGQQQLWLAGQNPIIPPQLQPDGQGSTAAQAQMQQVGEGPAVPAIGQPAAALQPGQLRQAVVPGSRTDREAAFCQNYENCIVSWERQAAYIDWALEALPADHPVVAAYTADLQYRKQLASISRSSLWADGMDIIIAAPCSLQPASSSSAGSNRPTAAGQMPPAGDHLVQPTSVGKDSSTASEVRARVAAPSTREYRPGPMSAPPLSRGSNYMPRTSKSDSKPSSVWHGGRSAAADARAAVATAPVRRMSPPILQADTMRARPSFKHVSRTATVAAARASRMHAGMAAPSARRSLLTVAEGATASAMPVNMITGSAEVNKVVDAMPIQRNGFSAAGLNLITESEQSSPGRTQANSTEKVQQPISGSTDKNITATFNNTAEYKRMARAPSNKVKPTRILLQDSKFQGVRKYACGNWEFELDPAQGGLTSLVKLYGHQHMPGMDWARGTAPPSSSSTSRSRSQSGRLSDPSHEGGCPGSSQGPGVLGKLLYHAYCEASYDFVAAHYSYVFPLPWWYPLDFFKVNSSSVWNQEAEATAALEEIYETHAPAGDSLEQLALRYSMPKFLVQNNGAPPTMWTVISCPTDEVDDSLDVSVVWQNKPPTRLPEALWFSFVPHSTAIDPDSWRLHKLDSTINPLEVVVNGSVSMHAVSDAGVSVHSADGKERLQISTLDASLVSPGKPTAFPNGVYPPCMATDGVHFNLENNVWSTNYVMWVPYSTQDVNMTFRFNIQASLL